MQQAIVVRTSVFFWLTFLSLGCMIPFLPQLLQQKGLTELQIGNLLAASLMIRVVSAPLFGYAIDRYQQTRRCVQGFGVAMAACFSVFWLTDNTWLLVLATLLCNVAFAPVLPVAESIGTQLSKKHQFSYGKVRLWGSLAFLAASLTTGFVTESFGQTGLIACLVISSIMVSASTLVLPDVRFSQTPVSLQDVTDLIKRRRFLIAIIGLSLAQASHAAYYTISSIHWASIGYTAGFIGMLWAMGVLAEVLVFSSAARLHRTLGMVGLGVGGTGFALTRWLITAEDPSTSVLLLIQCGQALSFGATQLAIIAFMQKEVSPGLSSTAQSVYSSLSNGIFLAIATAAAGWLYEIDSRYPYWLMSLMCAAAIPLIYSLRERPKPSTLKVSST